MIKTIHLPDNDIIHGTLGDEERSATWHEYLELFGDILDNLENASRKIFRHWKNGNWHTEMHIEEKDAHNFDAIADGSSIDKNTLSHHNRKAG